MVIDYSERRQSRRMHPTRPQRPSAWPYALIIIALIIAAYLIGVATGWYLFRPGGRFCQPVPQPQSAAAKPAAPAQPQPASATAPANPPHGEQAEQPQQKQSLNPIPPADKGAPVPLTFYNTLQKGNKGLMGTGINQPKEEQGGTPKPATPAQPER